MRDYNPYVKLMTRRDFLIIESAEKYRCRGIAADGVPGAFGWLLESGRYIDVYTPRGGLLTRHCAPVGHRISHDSPYVKDKKGGYYILYLSGKTPQEVELASKSWERVRRRYEDRTSRGERCFDIEACLEQAQKENNKILSEVA